MLTQEQISHFNTFGFLRYRQFFSPVETHKLSTAFDAAMKRARGGAPEPDLAQDADGYSTKSQDLIPFFQFDPETFYPLLDDPRIMDGIAALIGDDFLLAMHSAVIYGGGTKWHHDVVAPEGLTTMRWMVYLDRLGPEDGCLTIMPGSHLKPYRDTLVSGLGNFKNENVLGVPQNDVPGQHHIVNEPGDAIFFNHKLYHCSIGRRPGVIPGRRILRITCLQRATREKNPEHHKWIAEYLNGITKSAGAVYCDDLLKAAGPRCKEILERGMSFGFGIGRMIEA